MSQDVREDVVGHFKTSSKMSQDVLEMSGSVAHRSGDGDHQAGTHTNQDQRVLELVPADHTSLTANEVMTARDVPDLLHLPLSTVYHLACEGQLPAKRFGRARRFLRPRLEELMWE